MSSGHAEWPTNRDTVEFSGSWESIYNVGFNYGEFATIVRYRSRAFVANSPNFVESVEIDGVGSCIGPH
jgi:hypothetical protein